MSEIQKIKCVCGKSRDNLNVTNWKRHHVDNCKVKKKNRTFSLPITSFYPAPKKLRSEAGVKDGKFYIHLNCF